jgi:sigma-E factor negative regulatory protein RseB
VTVCQQQSKINTWPALCVLVLLGSAAHAQSEHPSDWLNRMAAAIQNTNYEGTVLRMRDGNYQALKIVHTVSDGVVRERVLIQEGNGLEIIRNGNEVHCILPDEKSVVIAEWDEQSTLFSTLPSADIRFGNEYDISIVREERVAGRKAALLAIRPHDNFRFGHKIWLDVETGFPLQTQLYAQDGTTIEEVKFADISFDNAIPASALAPSYSTENYRWFTQPRRAVGRLVESGWTNDDLPAGFRLISAKAEQLPVSDAPITHLMYGDGLAEVSVFVATRVDDKVTQRTTEGALNTYGLDVGDFRVTAIGEVPAETVEQIATSMRQP